MVSESKQEEWSVILGLVISYFLSLPMAFLVNFLLFLPGVGQIFMLLYMDLFPFFFSDCSDWGMIGCLPRAMFFGGFFVAFLFTPLTYIQTKRKYLQNRERRNHK